jgi:hypothetical protein
VYFTPAAQNEAAQNVWNTATIDVIRAADLFFPTDAIIEDIKLLGLQEYINYSETATQENTRAEGEIPPLTRSPPVRQHKKNQI